VYVGLFLKGVMICQVFFSFVVGEVRRRKSFGVVECWLFFLGYLDGAEHANFLMIFSGCV
jgi:hypothetical protein